MNPARDFLGGMFRFVLEKSLGSGEVQFTNDLSSKRRLGAMIKSFKFSRSGAGWLMSSSE